MGCCRGRRRNDNRHYSSECKSLEDSGARTVVRVMPTNQGSRLVVATQHGFVDLGSFVASFRCTGPTAQILRRSLPTIQRALALDASAFAPYRSGIGITDLVRVAERVTKGAKQRVQKRPPQVPSFPAR